ncbi:MAG: hypothetical protein UZ11_BCD004001747 [Bacteroidetes bacterium OLB11]|nr:MAG: hypothetical protein UZ11_BCD004001747 [Bacteroidetes bacterium OLB11]
MPKKRVKKIKRQPNYEKHIGKLDVSAQGIGFLTSKDYNLDIKNFKRKLKDSDER